MQMYDVDVIKRFWDKVNIQLFGACWEWKAGVDKDGYGRFYLQRRWKPAHRVAWEITHKRVLTSKLEHVCHECDNPPCCNPRHLYLGDSDTNIGDRVRRGRSARGEKSGGSKLTTKEVLLIRELREVEMLTCKVLMSRFAASKSAINKVLRRATWTHI
ncbi:hypothetical protein LCGC14_1347910 [marine sediment metagenome]|uniref:HNH nuclease domain-containing protein n=1 Tax=marine sediment metagenome TaxID=412755 RepID=A0A0F9KXU0_9ZZZZ